MNFLDESLNNLNKNIGKEKQSKIMKMVDDYNKNEKLLQKHIKERCKWTSFNVELVDEVIIGGKTAHPYDDVIYSYNNEPKISYIVGIIKITPPEGSPYNNGKAFYTYLIKGKGNLLIERTGNILIGDTENLVKINYLGNLEI